MAEWHTSMTCPPLRRKTNHQETETRDKMMGGSDCHQALLGLLQYRCPTLYDFNLIHFYQHCNSILSTNNFSDTDNIQLNPNIVFVMLDSGATMHFFTPNTPRTDTQKLTCGTLCIYENFEVFPSRRSKT